MDVGMQLGLFSACGLCTNQPLRLFTTIFKDKIDCTGWSTGRHGARPGLADSKFGSSCLHRGVMIVVVFLRDGRQKERRKSTGGE